MIRVKHGGEAEFQCVKKALISEFNALGIRNLTVQDLNLLNGFFVNLEYTLPSGQTAKFLKDENLYLGSQVRKADGDRWYGLAADADFLMVCEYGDGGADAQLVAYKKRER